MKILVAFKVVADPAGWTIGVPGPDVSLVINPFDAIAIEEALRTREAGAAEQVTAVTIGTGEVEDQVRAALAMGVDRAIRIDDGRPLDPYVVSRVLRAVVESESPDLVLMGKQAVDDDCNQTGQMLAGLLGWPQAMFVSKLEINDDGKSATCTRETDAGLEVVTVRLPAVITSDLRLNEPRYVSMPGLIKARRKSIETMTCEALGVSAEPMTWVLATESPPMRPPGTMVESVEQLMTKLVEEAKAI